MNEWAEQGALGKGAVDDFWLLENHRPFVKAAETARSLAATAGGSAPTRFVLPGLTLDVHCMDAVLMDLMTCAFAHRRTADRAPRAETFDWHIISDAGLGDVLSLPAPKVPLGRYGILQYSAHNTVLVERRAGFCTVFEPKEQRFTTLVAQAELIDNDVRAKPLLRFLYGLSYRAGFVMVHAAVLGVPDRGLLVTGLSGAGKSTLSAAALEVGATFVSDDFVLLRAEATGYRAHSLYASALITDKSLAMVPGLAGRTLPPQSDAPWQKHLINVVETYPSACITSLPLKGLAMLERRAEGGVVIEPVGKADLLRVLAPTSILASPWREPSRGQAIFDVVGALPTFKFTAGTNTLENARCLVEFVRNAD
ncbi:MAG: hypothetical protein AAF307_05230 [Pseudomonadota bacterium]